MGGALIVVGLIALVNSQPSTGRLTGDDPSAELRWQIATLPLIVLGTGCVVVVLAWILDELQRRP